MGRKRIRILNIGKDKLHFVDCKDDEGDMSRNSINKGDNGWVEKE